MSKKKKEPQLTRREKLYQFLIGTMLHKNLGGINDEKYLEYEKEQGFTYFDRNFEVGDIVLTSGSLRANNNPWCVGVCVEKHSDYEIVIRDIFSGMDCNYSNESYVSVHNIPFRYTLCEKDYKLYRQLSNAIDEVDPYRFDFRVCGAEPEKGGVTFMLRRKWKNFEGDKYFVKYRTRSSEMRQELQERMDIRKKSREEKCQKT